MIFVAANLALDFELFYAGCGFLESPMTYLEKMTDLLSKVDAACVFARSKAMGHLLENVEHPSGTLRGEIMGAGTTIGVMGSLIAAATFGWLDPRLAAFLCGGSILLVPVIYVFTKFSQLENYRKEAQRAGVCVMKNADQSPTAVTKMRIIDAYEYWDFPQEQLAVLKSLAQRDDIPAGWWQSAAQLINRYQEYNLESTR